MTKTNLPIIISGICDVCQKEFERPKARNEHANGWNINITDTTVPAKLICASAVCKATAKKMNKSHRNRKSNAKHNKLNPYRNSQKNAEAEQHYVLANDRFSVVINQPAFFYRILATLTAKVIRDRQTEETFSIVRKWSSVSINGVSGKKGLWQSWYTYIKSHGFVLSELFRKEDPIDLGDTNLAQIVDYIPDEEIDVVYGYIVLGTSTFTDMVECLAKSRIYLNITDQSSIEDVKAPSTYSYRIIKLTATKFNPGKSFEIDDAYELVKTKPNAEKWSQEFKAITIELKSLKGLANYLNACGPRDLTMYSRPVTAPDNFTIKPSSWLKLYDMEQETAFARTKDNFFYPAKQVGVLMLDFDGIESYEQALDNLFTTVPVLKKFSYVWQPSSSSDISYGKNQLTGQDGMHVYFLVDDASRIPELVQTIYKRSVLAGFGKVEHRETKQGIQVIREALIDASTGSPERADFTCKNELKRGLVQNRKAVYVAGESDVVSVSLLPALNPSEERLYAEKHEMVTPDNSNKVFGERAKRNKNQIIMNLTDTLTFVTGRHHKTVTVAEVVADKSYHQRNVVCPLTGQTGIAKVFFNDDGLILVHTFADGGVNFILKGKNVNVFEKKKPEVVIKKEEPKIQAVKSSGKSKILAY